MIVARISHSCCMYLYIYCMGCSLQQNRATMMKKSLVTVKTATKNNLQIETTTTTKEKHKEKEKKRKRTIDM